jgi:peptidoglycan/xylan/chitin deacetylase (PgdA/CDA1 family)
MYHRVAHPQADPWELAVRPDHFEQQLDVLRRSRRPMPMPDFLHGLEHRTLPTDAVAVTFDDGYADNLHEAKPRLAARGIPATVFLTTGAVGQPTEYWWDELARALLLRCEAMECEIAIAGETFRLVLPRTGEPAGIWRAWQEPRTERQAAYLAIWRRLRTAPAGDREAAMNLLRDRLSLPAADAADLPMTEAEVADLTADGLVEIGGHTETHPVLTALDSTARRRDIMLGKLACERLVQKSIAGFAYPHGALDDDSRAAVANCGFAWACSTESRAVSDRHYDRYALPRIAVADSDGEAFERMLHAVSA